MRPKIKKTNEKYMVKRKANERHQVRAYSTKARTKVLRKELENANDAGVVDSADDSEPGN